MERKKNHLSLFLTVLLVLAILSCSKSDEETIPPEYSGKWERTWFSDTYNENLVQILQIEKGNFYSFIKMNMNNSLVTITEFEGTQIVIDNTLEAWISKIGSLNQGQEMIYMDITNSDFHKTILETLKIHSSFIGTFGVQSNELTLMLDYDGDGRSGGNEGSITFQRVND